MSLRDIEYRLREMEPFLKRRQSPYGTFPTKGGDGGDDCLWLGLLSCVGVEEASKGLIACQSTKKRKGMFYRNPVRRSNDSAGYSHFFSRDMACGVLAHFSKHGFKDKSKAKKTSLK